MPVALAPGHPPNPGGQRWPHRDAPHPPTHTAPSLVGEPNLRLWTSPSGTSQGYRARRRVGIEGPALLRSALADFPQVRRRSLCKARAGAAMVLPTRMRVLYLTYGESLLGHASRGVMETQVRDVLAALHEHVDVKWLGILPKTQRHAARDGGIRDDEWIDYRFVLRDRSTPTVPRAVAIVRTTIDTWKPTVIHARGYQATLVALLASKKRVRVVFDPRGIMPAERVAYSAYSPRSPNVLVWRQLERYLARNAAAVVGVSDPMTQYFHVLAPRTKCVTVPLAVDVGRFRGWTLDQRSAQRGSLGLGPEDNVVTYSGSLRPAGIRHLARGIKRIAESTPAAVFLLLTRDDTSPLEQAIGDRVRCVIRRAAYKDMPAFLSCSDWGLILRAPRNPPILNQIEATTKFPEYLASGLSVVVNSTSTWLSDVVTQYELGKIVDPLSQTPILLSRPTDDDRVRAAGYAQQHHSLDRVVADYLSLYGGVQ